MWEPDIIADGSTHAEEFGYRSGGCISSGSKGPPSLLSKIQLIKHFDTFWAVECCTGTAFRYSTS